MLRRELVTGYWLQQQDISHTRAQRRFTHLRWKKANKQTNENLSKESTLWRTESWIVSHLRLVNEESDESGHQHGAWHGRAFPARLRFAEGENRGRGLLEHRHRVWLTQAGHYDDKTDPTHELNLCHFIRDQLSAVAVEEPIFSSHRGWSRCFKLRRLHGKCPWANVQCIHE